MVIFSLLAFLIDIKIWLKALFYSICPILISNAELCKFDSIKAKMSLMVKFIILSVRFIAYKKTFTTYKISCIINGVKFTGKRFIYD